MRIRKHAARVFSSPSIPSQSFAAANSAAATVSAAAVSAAAAEYRELERCVCQLNQSPWDAIDFTLPGISALYEYQEAENAEHNAWSGQGDDEPAAASSAPLSDWRYCRAKEEKEMAGEEGKEKIGSELEARKRNTSNNTMRTKTKNISSAAKERTGLESAKTKAESAVAEARTCTKTDGKGRQCKEEAQPPHSSCQYHLALERSRFTNGGATSLRLPQQPPIPKSHGRRGTEARQNASSVPEEEKIRKSQKGRGARKGNKTGKDAKSGRRREPPSDYFYYYSGFGPLWGKRRSGGDGDHGASKPRNVETSDGKDNSDGAPSPKVHDQAPDDLDDDDDEDADDTEDGGDLGECDGDDAAVSNKRKGRKPVKARSLKSLL